MKPIYLKLIAVLCSVFLVLGCIEIEEQVSIKNNGSGKYSAVIKMPQMKQMMELARSMEEEKGGSSTENPMGEMQTKFDEQKQKMEKIPGITNFSTVFDTANFVITVKFDFANVAALNKCLNAFKTEESEEGEEVKKEDKVIYTYANKVFNIKASSSFADYDSIAADDTMALEMMKDMKYTGSYKFESQIKSHTNKSYVLGKDKKSLTVSATVADLVRKKIKLEDKITLQ
ncbi:MAG: hypothetical protein K2X86_09390 [Cytophagaceae bacterium]|nr:hypothetical protein [Cytophagaceae bacterium]